MEDFEELLDLAAIFLFIDSSAYVGNRMNVAPSTLTVSAGATFLADSRRATSITPACVRDYPHVAPAALAVIIYVAWLTDSCTIFILFGPVVVVVAYAVKSFLGAHIFIAEWSFAGYTVIRPRYAIIGFRSSIEAGDCDRCI